jgi:hypothetical protein
LPDSYQPNKYFEKANERNDLFESLRNKDMAQSGECNIAQAGNENEEWEQDPVKPIERIHAK